MEKNTLTSRPPIVVILGHVDHGKTSLLDKIRKTNITAREAGGITQSIGAWQVETPKGDKITFIDTPGHEAFGKMRARGAKIADIAILVVSADDGVMPQTIESLQYIKEAQIPFLVAITKIDLPGVQVEKVKTQLADNGVMLEGRGALPAGRQGDVVAVEVSSVSGQGIEDLLEMIALVAQMHGIKGLPEDSLEAPVIETLMHYRRGPVVRAVVRAGILNAGDIIGVEGQGTKIRGLFDENQHPVKTALPGMPVEILGFETLPPVGSVLTTAGGVQNTVQQQEKLNRKSEGLPIILKTDTAGSLEAIENKLTNTVGVKLAAASDISESDVLFASTTGAIIVGFNVRAPKTLLKFAENEGIKIYTYKIIYELLADIDKWVKEKESLGQEKVLGRAQIIAEFPHDKKRVAGARVAEGRIIRSDKLRLVRAEEVIGNIRSVSLKKQKLDVDKVAVGDEFGMLFEPQLDFKIGDVIESWQ